ncbi:myrosinase 1-like [Zootermopsis nevadensis]|uniref:myrosinase 1-like n=1 Tax=Zootermopsis nevadensis TaxID=136037 RepID=UPI000B8E3868|nr:myrosinase 1-like [Zootermopsis nevadensis]XP_021942296.1 myrosinase 1-like [Zootermopsis nevadensis]XP_021942419.1 myrosinase 1-like [Zootermopsis nevadensis]
MASRFFWCCGVLVGAACGFNRTLPENFMLGASTSAYQIEGAWNENGKGPSIWDTYAHEGSFIVDGATGDVAADSYHQYEQDVSALTELGADFYRFSISWPRILPTGHVNAINQEGVGYYDRLIKELRAKDIEPVVTMYHWDLPQPLQDLGGWTNPVMADFFEDYARVLFSAFGDRVKWWITINEPYNVILGYNAARPFAPGVEAKGVGHYLAAHTLIRAHAKAYRLYEKKFKADQEGRLGLSLCSHWFEPMTNSSADVEVAEASIQLVLGLFAHPVYSSEGDYTQMLRKIVDQVSAAQGFNRSHLRHFSPEEVSTIRGTFDFFGLNYYSTRLANALLPLDEAAKSEGDYVNLTVSANWPTSVSEVVKVVPWGLRKLLAWIKDKYDNVPVFITENGFPDSGQLDDVRRSQYIVSHMSEMLKAIYQDGCNVFGYTVWSLIDNMEWSHGYTEKFGLYHVNFSDPNRQRTPKSSARVFSEIIKRRRLPESFLRVETEFSSEITMEYATNNCSSPTQHVTHASSGRNLFPCSRKFLAVWLATLTCSSYIFRL